VIHAYPDVKGVENLIDELAPLIYLHVTRSYELPTLTAKTPPNVIWLHFGKGARWSSEYWDEQRAARLKQ
jgi:hypothetical protein